MELNSALPCRNGKPFSSSEIDDDKGDCPILRIANVPNLEGCISEILQPSQILLQIHRSFISLLLNLHQCHMILVPPVLDGCNFQLAMGDDITFELGGDVVSGDLQDVTLAFFR